MNLRKPDEYSLPISAIVLSTGRAQALPISNAVQAVFFRLCLARAAISFLVFSGKQVLRFIKVVVRDRVGNAYSTTPQIRANRCNTERGSTALTIRKPLKKIYVRDWMALAHFANC